MTDGEDEELDSKAKALMHLLKTSSVRCPPTHLWT